MSRYSKEQHSIASDIVLALNTNSMLSYEDIARKVGLGKGLTATLCARLADYQVVRVCRYKGKKLVEMAPNLFNCDERTKELWVLGAIHEDM